MTTNRRDIPRHLFLIIDPGGVPLGCVFTRGQARVKIRGFAKNSSQPKDAYDVVSYVPAIPIAHPTGSESAAREGD